MASLDERLRSLENLLAVGDRQWTRYDRVDNPDGSQAWFKVIETRVKLCTVPTSFTPSQVKELEEVRGEGGTKRPRSSFNAGGGGYAY